MKCINSCGECGYYIRQTDACTRGAHKDPDPEALFFADCPLKDVQPVVHAQWTGNYKSHCSRCGAFCIIAYIGEHPNYCPNCGALMDEEVEE